MGIFLTLIGLLPSILQSVVTIEGAFGHAPGPVKKQLILNPVGTAAKALGVPDVPALLKVTGTLVDTSVASLNSVGLLGKPAPAKLLPIGPAKPAVATAK